jgi:hypothetical protein
MEQGKGENTQAPPPKKKKHATTTNCKKEAFSFPLAPISHHVGGITTSQLGYSPKQHFTRYPQKKVFCIQVRNVGHHNASVLFIELYLNVS